MNDLNAIINSKSFTVCMYTFCFIVVLKVTFNVLDDYGMIEKKVEVLG